MPRASAQISVLAALVLGSALAGPAARADDREPAQLAPAAHGAAAVPGAPGDLRAELASQLADQAATIDRTLATVGGKLTDADAVRLHRLRAAYRLLRAPTRASATADERMAAARRRAAARLLIDRDAAERGLLTDETRHLREAAARTEAVAQRVATITLPEELARPVRGAVARKFGVLEHERSKATLSRRGVDLEVESHAAVTAPADGTVRYAGPIRGLDGGVILDHGDYLTVIAKLGEIAVPVGAPLRRGDRLGRAARHRVYVEVRVKLGPGGLPIDPEPLFAAGAAAATGKPKLHLETR